MDCGKRERSKFQLLACAGMVLVPLLVSQLAPGNTILEWRKVTFTVATVQIVANIAFCCMCSDKPQRWALVDQQSKDSSSASCQRKTVEAQFENQRLEGRVN